MLNQFEKNIKGIYGKEGETWLSHLPQIVRSFEEAWGVSHLTPVKNLSYNYVLKGARGKAPIILKLSLDFDGLEREAAALKAFANYCAVRVLNQKKGALLLERAVPGTSLKEIFPEKESMGLEVAIQTIRQLHQAPVPQGHSFPKLTDWLRTLDKDFPSIPLFYLKTARSLRDKLLATTKESVLLHGDLHHENILQDGAGWVLIDPKGIVGDPVYEAGSFIRNPILPLLNLPEAEKIIDLRIQAFSEAFDWEKKRIEEWCFVQAVVAWTWALGDKGESIFFQQLTDIFGRKIT